MCHSLLELHQSENVFLLTDLKRNICLISVRTREGIILFTMVPKRFKTLGDRLDL